MSNAPERIWHQHDTAGHLADLRELAVKPVDDVRNTAFTEYVHADLYAAQQETIAALVEALEGMLALYGRPGGRAQRQARAALAKAKGET
jgi:hypothetical protein